MMDDPETCRWTFNIDGFWETGCGEAWQLSEGGPTENGMLYCYHCGKRLVEGEGQ